MGYAVPRVGWFKDSERPVIIAHKYAREEFVSLHGLSV